MPPAKEKGLADGWWADFVVVYPEALKASLATVPSFVHVRGGSPLEGFAREVRMVADSRDPGGSVSARLHLTEDGGRMRLTAQTREARDLGVLRMEMLLGGVVRKVGDGGE